MASSRQRRMRARRVKRAQGATVTISGNEGADLARTSRTANKHCDPVISDGMGSAKPEVGEHTATLTTSTLTTLKKEDQQATSEVEDTRPSRRRQVLIFFGWAIAASVVGMIAASQGSKSLGETIVTGIIYGVLITSTYYGYFFMKTRLGWLTSAVAVALLWAVLIGVIVAAIPHCPGNSATGRCQADEIGSWSLGGALIPVQLLILAIPVVAGRKLWKARNERNADGSKIVHSHFTRRRRAR